MGLDNNNLKKVYLNKLVHINHHQKEAWNFIFYQWDKGKKSWGLKKIYRKKKGLSTKQDKFFNVEDCDKAYITKSQWDEISDLTSVDYKWLKSVLFDVKRDLSMMGHHQKKRGIGQCMYWSNIKRDEFGNIKTVLMEGFDKYGVFVSDTNSKNMEGYTKSTSTQNNKE